MQRGSIISLLVCEWHFLLTCPCTPLRRLSWSRFKLCLQNMSLKNIPESNENVAQTPSDFVLNLLLYLILIFQWIFTCHALQIRVIEELLATSGPGIQFFLRPGTICNVRKMRHLGDKLLSQNVDSWITVIQFRPDRPTNSKFDVQNVFEILNKRLHVVSTVASLGE